MANQIKLVVVTPERLVFEQMVDDVELPGRGGELGVLAEHALLLSMLDTGVLTYHRDGRREMIAVSGGYVEVRPDCVTVLAETAETPEEIDIERARLAREYALKELRASAEEIDFMRARAKLQKAVVRLYVATGGEEGERP